MTYNKISFTTIPDAHNNSLFCIVFWTERQYYKLMFKDYSSLPFSVKLINSKWVLL